MSKEDDLILAKKYNLTLKELYYRQKYNIALDKVSCKEIRNV